MTELFIGLMSGTSMDGIDAALVEFSQDDIKLIAQHSHTLPITLTQKLKLLTLDSPEANIDMLGSADTELGLVFSDAVNQLLTKASIEASQITAIGSHGHTVRHRPDLKSNFSMQIGDANRISFLTGITTIADFRRKDMAAGGEGAPLAPAFHQQVFRSNNENRAVLNIGGIANLTYLAADMTTPCLGFDTGPGNTLMDAWIFKHKNMAYDKDGQWAASSKADKSLVSQLMKDKFVLSTPPKSSGREHYHLPWLEQHLTQYTQLNNSEIQSSLSQFTCDSIIYAIENHLPEKIKTLIVCGGGTHNKHLMNQLKHKLADVSVESSENYGVAPDWVEAIAFAWLARQTLQHLPGNIPSVTGASQSLVLGAIYPV